MHPLARAHTLACLKSATFALSLLVGATAGGRDLSRDPISQKLSPAGIAIRVTFNQSCACNVWTFCFCFFFPLISTCYTQSHTHESHLTIITHDLLT